MEDLSNKKVAILATDGFEEPELKQPFEALKEQKAKVDIVALKSGTIKAWNRGEWSSEYPVDKTIDEVNSDDYDALVLPGGVINPDKLRRSGKAVQFVRSFIEDHKPVAAICHGPWMLAEAGVLEGRRMTSFHSIKTDMVNAGANWENSEVVVDEAVITSRSPKDLDAFIDKIMEEIKKGKREKETA